jgi:hypothetical protein
MANAIISYALGMQVKASSQNKREPGYIDELIILLNRVSMWFSFTCSAKISTCSDGAKCRMRGNCNSHKTLINTFDSMEEYDMNVSNCGNASLVGQKNLAHW